MTTFRIAATTALLLAQLAAGQTAADLHAPYGELLATYVGPDGSVAYERWHANSGDVARLDAYLSRLASAPTDQAFWINLYNAVVLREILRRWPLASVREVTGRDGGVQGGDAFFKDLTFAVGRRQMTLDELENEIIRATFKDARAHFAINCGSRSCPVLKPTPFEGPRLPKQLDDAARAFINDRRNVAVNDADRSLVLSKIFDWYRQDFNAFARGRDQPADLIGFLLLYAEPDLSAALRRARAKDYRIVFRDYDWGLNVWREPPPPVARPRASPNAAGQPPTPSSQGR